MSTPPTQPRPHPENEFDRNWEGLQLDQIHQLDALCDRLEQSLNRDPDSRIETFVAGLTAVQQRLALQELLPLERVFQTAWRLRAVFRRTSARSAQRSARPGSPRRCGTAGMAAGQTGTGHAVSGMTRFIAARAHR